MRVDAGGGGPMYSVMIDSVVSSGTSLTHGPHQSFALLLLCRSPSLFTTCTSRSATSLLPLGVWHGMLCFTAARVGTSWRGSVHQVTCMPMLVCCAKAAALDLSLKHSTSCPHRRGTGHRSRRTSTLCNRASDWGTRRTLSARWGPWRRSWCSPASWRTGLTRASKAAALKFERPTRVPLSRDL